MKKRLHMRSEGIRSALIIFLAGAVTVICADAVFAIGGGSGGHHESSPADWLWPVVNFAFIFSVLFYFGRKPISEYFKKRTEIIEQSLKAAAEAKEAAEKALSEVQSKLSTADSEVEQIIERAKKAGEREKEALIAEGEQLKEKIIAQAKANIDFELQKAREAMKSDAALMAIELAEQQIKEKLGQKEQENLIDDYIKKLEASN